MKLQTYLNELERTAENLASLASRWDNLPEDVQEFRLEAIYYLLFQRDQALDQALRVGGQLPFRISEADTRLRAGLRAFPHIGIDQAELVPRSTTVVQVSSSLATPDDYSVAA